MAEATQKTKPVTLVWEDPPPKAARGRKKLTHWDRLRKNPGRWARLSLSSFAAHHYKNRNPGFEITQRNIKGKVVIYARYVPPTPDTPGTNGNAVVD